MSPHPQPEYIIGNDKLKEIYDLERWMWLMIPSKDWDAGGYKLTDINALRSRPYTFTTSDQDRVLDAVIQEITQAAPVMEGKQLFITVLSLCRRIDRLRTPAPAGDLE